ncbi:malate dehydrogenase [Scenedesmus sp. PABB004]|nr:malate dehydrogenase [Scenedesmus sp. PABB004]
MERVKRLAAHFLPGGGAKAKVAVLGAAGGIGQPLALLLKGSPLIGELSLYDVANTAGVAADLSHISTAPRVRGYTGQAQLLDALRGCQLVVIPAGVPRKPGMTRDDLFNINAGIVATLCEAIAAACPDAWVAIISNPVNSTVPIAAEVFKRAGTYNPARLFGVTTLDVVRAEAFVAELLGADPKDVTVPVVGGHAGATILPLLSQAKPALSLDAQRAAALMARIQDAGTEVVNAKAGAGSATLSMAWAAARFAESCLRAMAGESGVVECTYVASALTSLPFFASPVRLGRSGVEEFLPLGAMNELEQRNYDTMLPELGGSIQKGVEFVAKRAAAARHPRTSPFDWRLLHGVDADELVRRNDTAALEALVPALQCGGVDGEAAPLSAADYVQLLRLVQLAVEHLWQMRESHAKLFAVYVTALAAAESWKAAAGDYLGQGGRLLGQLRGRGALLTEGMLAGVAAAREALEKADRHYNAALDSLEARGALRRGGRRRAQGWCGWRPPVLLSRPRRLIERRPAAEHARRRRRRRRQVARGDVGALEGLLPQVAFGSVQGEHPASLTPRHYRQLLALGQACLDYLWAICLATSQVMERQTQALAAASTAIPELTTTTEEVRAALAAALSALDTAPSACDAASPRGASPGWPPASPPPRTAEVLRQPPSPPVHCCGGCGASPRAPQRAAGGQCCAACGQAAADCQPRAVAATPPCCAPLVSLTGAGCMWHQMGQLEWDLRVERERTEAMRRTLEEATAMLEALPPARGPGAQQPLAQQPQAPQPAPGGARAAELRAPAAAPPDEHGAVRVVIDEDTIRGEERLAAGDQLADHISAILRDHELSRRLRASASRHASSAGGAAGRGAAVTFTTVPSDAGGGLHASGLHSGSLHGGSRRSGAGRSPSASPRAAAPRGGGGDSALERLLAAQAEQLALQQAALERAGVLVSAPAAAPGGLQEAAAGAAPDGALEGPGVAAALRRLALLEAAPAPDQEAERPARAGSAGGSPSLRRAREIMRAMSPKRMFSGAGGRPASQGAAGDGEDAAGAGGGRGSPPWRAASPAAGAVAALAGEAARAALVARSGSSFSAGAAARAAVVAEPLAPLGRPLTPGEAATLSPLRASIMQLGNERRWLRSGGQLLPSAPRASHHSGLLHASPPRRAGAAAVLALLLLACLAVSRSYLPRAAAAPGGGSSSRSVRAGGGGSLRGLRTEKAAFLRTAAGAYGYDGWLDCNFHREVGSRLGDKLKHYLDYTAAALVTRSNLAAASALLQRATLSNPHSRSACGLRTTRELEAAARTVLEWFNADPEEYTVVWNSGATQGLKLVGEAFPWTSPADWTAPRAVRPGGVSDAPGGTPAACGAARADAARRAPRSSHFVYLRANHKSVLGIGAYARERGVPLSCVDEDGMAALLAAPGGRELGGEVGEAGGDGDSGDDVTYSLLAFPLKDNYEGRLYPQAWIEAAHARSTPRHRWLVVADAAAYVPTHALDLRAVRPDFVPISFYKMFGYPTGLGALIARREAIALLHKVYFGGGSVADATAQDAWRLLAPAPTGYMDGTTDYLGISQLQFGFDQLRRLGGMQARAGRAARAARGARGGGRAACARGPPTRPPRAARQAIHAHTSALQAWTAAALGRLAHSNGAPLVRLFGAHGAPGGEQAQQSCVFNFLVLQPDGSPTSQVVVEDAAYEAGLALRTGCMCNPGQCQFRLGIPPEEERHVSSSGVDCSSGFMAVERPGANASAPAVRLELPIGSVRASLGFLSTFEDVYALVSWLEATFADGRTPPRVAGTRRRRRRGL